MKKKHGIIQRLGEETMARTIRRRLDRLQEKISDSLELPRAAMPGAAQIELSDNREALVDGCRGVLQYDSDVIRLSTGRMVLRFTGQDLMIRAMQESQLLISGTIVSVDFS